jgi:tRNA C32,U32 (ribose-2'-O)-methylase TrmJ
MIPGTRALNLSNAVAICLYDAWRQVGFPEWAEIFDSRHLERVGDHAKNIAEATIYMETGALSAIEQQEDTETT